MYQVALRKRHFPKKRLRVPCKIHGFNHKAIKGLNYDKSNQLFSKSRYYLENLNVLRMPYVRKNLLALIFFS